MRDLGEIEAIQAAVPEWLFPVAELLTTLGDLPVLLAIACLALWLGERDRGAYAVGLMLGGLALMAGLKATFALPRPPAGLHLIETGSTSFPSGHAMGATVVYGTLAMTLERLGTSRQRLAIAGVLVAAIALSRVVLGVHYAADVLAGIAFGVAYLAGASSVTGDDPVRAFGLAAVVAGIGLVVGVASGPTPYATCLETVCVDRDAFAAVVVTASAFVAWLAVCDDRRIGGLVLATVIAPVAALTLLVGAIDPSVGARGLIVGLAIAGALVASGFERRSRSS